MNFRSIQTDDGTVEVVLNENAPPLTGPLRHERSIVWLKDISKLRFVRVHIAKGCKNRRGPIAVTGGAMMVGYATLARDAKPGSPGGTYTRRLFYVTKADLANQRLAPHGAVDPRSISPGDYGRDFGSDNFEQPVDRRQAEHDPQPEDSPATPSRRAMPMMDVLLSGARQQAKSDSGPSESDSGADASSENGELGLGMLTPMGGGDPVPLVRHKLVVGRRETSDIVLRFKNVSGSHCHLFIDEGYWFVEDFGSTNGTKVNGVRVAPNIRKRLDPGDRLSVAKHHFEIEYSPAELGAVGTPPPDGQADSAMPEKSLLERIGI